MVAWLDWWRLYGTAPDPNVGHRTDRQASCGQHAPMTHASSTPADTATIPLRHALTGITVLPEEIPHLVTRGPAAAELGGADRQSRASSGARVTVEFTAPSLIPANCEVAVPYDLANNGRWRECRGIPSFTHCTAPAKGPGATYHYRLSQWIVAGHVMDFLRVDNRQPAA